MIRITAQFLLLLTSVFFFQAQAKAEEKLSIVPPLLVVDSNFFKEDSKNVDQLASLLGSASVSSAKNNPVCCVWLTKFPESAVPKDTYVIAHNEHTVIYVSSGKALEQVIKKLKSELLAEGKMKIGIFTSENKREKR